MLVASSAPVFVVPRVANSSDSPTLSSIMPRFTAAGNNRQLVTRSCNLRLRARLEAVMPGGWWQRSDSMVKKRACIMLCNLTLLCKRVGARRISATRAELDSKLTTLAEMEDHTTPKPTPKLPPTATPESRRALEAQGGITPWMCEVCNIVFGSAQVILCCSNSKLLSMLHLVTRYSVRF